MIKSRVLRTGDGSHEYAKLAQKDAEAAIPIESHNNNNEPLRDTEHFWGFGKRKTFKYLILVILKLSIFSGDKEMTEEDMKNVVILKRALD